jgi:hypothetical protein
MFSGIRRSLLTFIEKVFFGGRKGLDNADEALRYLPISDLLLSGDLEDPRILEVGSGSKGITPYVPFTVTGLDVVFNGPVAPTLNPILHSGDRLPFADASYDVVISVDMLEHVPEQKRPEVIGELLRVARKRVFLAVPCGKAAQEHDSSLDQLYQRARGERYHFFAEHVDLGLPRKEELQQCIAASAGALGLSVSTAVYGNVNLKVRSFFMRVWIESRHPKLYSWISPVVCIFRRFLNYGECYRQIFVVDVARDRAA